MIDVRLVTCAELPAEDPDTPLLADALTGAGVRVELADWRDPSVDWSQAPLTVLRSPWDYVDTVGEFVDWARAASARTSMWNPLALVEWNLHKAYLLDLEARGAPVVPTVVLLHGAAASLGGICDARGWNAVVIKPAVGSGGMYSGRFDVGDPAGQAHLDHLLARQDAIVQPFIPSVLDGGERSLILFDGAVSHALRKRPAPDEYRVHEERGGRTAVVEPGASEVDLATRVLDVLPGPAMYARIDLLQHNGLWHVLEVEATEPSLWLHLAPRTATEMFVDAVVARLV